MSRGNQNDIVSENVCVGPKVCIFFFEKWEVSSTERQQIIMLFPSCEVISYRAILITL